MLLVGEVLTPFEQQPAGPLQDLVAALALHAAGFLGADLIERLVHIGDDMETVEDMQGLGAVLPNELQIGLPHVRADERDFGYDFLAHGGEESPEGFDGPFLPTQSRRVMPKSI